VPQAVSNWGLLVLLALAATRAAGAQQPASDTGVAKKPPVLLDTVKVRGRVTDLVGLAASANQGVVGAADLALRPLLRPGEIVENIPGVIVTQHSGSGKANQYFLRGFNLDHGTDLAVSVDGVPVNLPSHAHGQGYADLNFVIPELIEGVDFKKGPYYADVGDFGSAGAFNLRYYDRLPRGVAAVDGGQFGYGRALVANNAGIGGANLVYAAELEHNDGPWVLGDDERKLDGMLRYAAGDATRGFTVTAMGYHNQWHATDQVPDRAIASGLIDRWGTIDSTDAGTTDRYAVTADWHRRDAQSTSRVLLYALRYDLDLYSDFTYFLDDPVHGDQIEQQDGRWVGGGTATHTWIGTLAGAPSLTTIGVQMRGDAIQNGLYHTQARIRLNPVTVNSIHEATAAPYVENQTDWTSWLRTIIGLRADVAWLDVRNTAGGSSGSAQGGLASPKGTLVLGPWANTEFYVDAGTGFHSNDARGVVAAVDPATPLVRSKGAEVGVRTAALPGLQTSVALWQLDLASELVWDGDAGGNTPSGPTRRYGVEWANYYTPTRWLTVDADYAWSHARFTDHEAQGDYVPEALVATFDGGIAVHDLEGALRGLRGGLRLRFFGPRPLTQDDSVRSKATSLVYADLGYDLNERWSLGLAVFNVLGAAASDIDYFYVSRLPGEPGAGVADVHTHPAEPRAIRVSLSARW